MGFFVKKNKRKIRASLTISFLKKIKNNNNVAANVITTSACHLQSEPVNLFLLITSFNYFSGTNYIPIMINVHIHKILYNYFRGMNLCDCLVSYFNDNFLSHSCCTTTCRGRNLHDALWLSFIKTSEFGSLLLTQK